MLLKPKAVPKPSCADVEAGLLGLLGVGAGLLELRVEDGLAELMRAGAGPDGQVEHPGVEAVKPKLRAPEPLEVEAGLPRLPRVR